MVKIIVSEPYYFELDVDQSVNVKFTRQINDILDIGYQKSSYTNSFKIPMTSNNVKIFGLLGVRGNNSDFPYRKISASLIVNEVPIVTNGWLSVISSGKGYYNCNIIDGVIDVFKHIENNNIGDLDLSKLNHRKTVQAVKERSMAGGEVVYVLGAYGGVNVGELWLNGAMQQFIDIDYQVPAVSKLYLLKSIFNFAGYSVSFENGETLDMRNDYITFPQEPDRAFIPVQFFTGHKDSFTSSVYVREGMIVKFDDEFYYDNYTTPQGSVINGWKYEFPITGKYIVNVKIKGKAIRRVLGNRDAHMNVYIYTSNSFSPKAEQIPISEDFEFSYETLGRKGGLIWIEFGTVYGGDGQYSLEVDFLDVEIDNIGSGDVDFTDVFKDYPMKGFVKEFLLKYGLIPIVDNVLKTVDLISIESFLDISKSKDISSHYVGTTNEVYTLANYARRNLVKYKYNDGESSINDGLISVNNENLQDERVIYQTMLYSPLSRVESINTRFNGVETSFESFVHPIWRPEPKEVEVNGERTIEIEHKPLNNRFYEVKPVQMNFATYLISKTTNERTNVFYIQVADINNSLLVETIPREYSKWQKVLNNFEMLSIELNISPLEVSLLDLTIPYYIDVLGAYYIINKIESSKEGLAKADIIKINL